MIFSITIADAAENDLKEVYSWYKEQNEDVANSFEIYLSMAVESIQRKPLKTWIRYKSIRIFFLQKFPYGIHFIIKDKTILIIAVFHTSVNPKRWKQRL